MTDRVSLAALAALVAAARALPIDRPDRALAFVAGLVTAGVENPATVRRCLAIAGVDETLWRQAAETVGEVPPRAGGAA